MTRQEIMLNEYRNRIEVADNVLSETRAKLTKAEHDRDRYKAEIERLKAQQREIERLKDDYAKLQELFAQYQMASDKEIIAQKKEAEKRFENNMKSVLEIEKKQAKIDVLNELRNRLVVYYPSVISVIDELIKEYEE